MRCLIYIPSTTHWRTPRSRSGRRYAPERVTSDFLIETTVYRIALPKTQNRLLPYVLVDAWIPEDNRKGIPILDPAWIEPGIYRTRALIKHNVKTLAPFLASGLEEMDVSKEAA
ncbi:hypothetical protein [Caballeronia grimmiae]|uniref:Uncharacterized protein n=1 Tax=Caballeronia grimmiae TaxID=1071679 RepID=A0ABQ1R9P2_9BURK|nr:hypothetical protein [Caballeronia grimmiae]GGD63254.1 hypothetical protein GCM10010985_16690 [Caballeronia grimmiae]